MLLSRLEFGFVVNLGRTHSLGLEESLVQIPQDVVGTRLPGAFFAYILYTTCLCLSESFTVATSSEL